MSAPKPPSDPAATRRPTLPGAVGFALALALVWLGGQFVRQGVSDEMLPGRPQLAVLWLGESPDALGQLARRRLALGDGAGAARLAARALRLSPFDAVALATYGLAQDRLGQAQAADRAVSLAGQRGWRDLPAQIWLMRRDLLAARFAGGFAHADAVLRRDPTPPPILFAILTAAARDPRATAPLADRLAANPSWRPAFFGFLADQARPPPTDVIVALFARLAGGPAPPTDEEIAPYLRLLVSRQRYAEAATAWRRFTTTAAGAGGGVYDGDFERPPGGTPFDWSLASGVGWTASIGASPGGARGAALNVEYDGVSPPQPLRQLLVLSPGAYRLSGRFLSEQGSAAPLFEWTLACVGEGQILATAPSPPGPAGVWRSFSAAAVVPAEGCPAQWLALKSQPAPERADVSVWYDQLAISPTSAALRPGTDSRRN
jgi:hypothetical protein